MIEISRPILHSMKTADVEGKVELLIQVKFGYIACVEIGSYTRVLRFSFCYLDGADCKIHTRNLPARFGKGNDVCACAATEVNGAARGMGLDEVEKFGRGDAAIPGGFAEIGEVEFEAAEHVC